MASNKRKLELVAAFEEKINEVNKACSGGTARELEARMNELDAIEKEFGSIRQAEVFAGLADAHEAILKHSFETLTHKKVSDNGRMTGVVAEKKEVLIDLRKFCEVKGIDLGWYWELQALNKRFTLRIAEQIGVTAAELKRIDDSYAMSDLASQIALGKTPTSDTQVVKHMQKVLDMLSPGEGKVNGHDLAYVMACYAKRANRSTLKLKCSNHKTLQVLMTDVFYRIATKGTYGVDYKSTGVQQPKEEPKDSSKAVSKPHKAKKAKVSQDSADSAPKAEVAAEAADASVPAPEVSKA